jgi:large subunit ribosomal protein L13
LLRRAVKGMLPKNKVGSKVFKKLKVYVGPHHPHEAQQPEQLQL